MATLIGLAVVMALMGAAYWLHGRLDGMATKAQSAIQPHVPIVKQRVKDNYNRAAQFVRPRAVGWARRLALGCAAHLVVFFGAATCVALVRPAPQEVTYASIAKRPDATWYQHAAAYVGYGSGWCVDEVKPGFLYSVARLNDGSMLIGLPGIQKWYRL
jgi:hypothetical protein